MKENRGTSAAMGGLRKLLLNNLSICVGSGKCGIQRFLLIHPTGWERPGRPGREQAGPFEDLSIPEGLKLHTPSVSPGDAH